MFLLLLLALIVLIILASLYGWAFNATVVVFAAWFALAFVLNLPRVAREAARPGGRALRAAWRALRTPWRGRFAASRGRGRPGTAGRGRPGGVLLL